MGWAEVPWIVRTPPVAHEPKKSSRQRCVSNAIEYVWVMERWNIGGFGSARAGCAMAMIGAAALSSSAAGNLHIFLVPRGSAMYFGGSMTWDIYADFSQVGSSLSIAEFRFDIGGYDKGYFTGDVYETRFPLGASDGTTGVTLTGFAGGQAPPNMGGSYTGNFLGSFTYHDVSTVINATVQPMITNFTSPGGALSVYTSASGAMSVASLTDSTGGFHTVSIESIPVDFYLVPPAPGTAMGMLIGVGMVTRRRR